MPTVDTILFAAFRLIVILIALFFSYLFVGKIITPYIFQPSCLTDTNSCYSANIWKKDNSFLAQLFPSGIWTWFNGQKLFVFGQSPGVCNKEGYEPVDTVLISKDSSGNLSYSRGNYECVISLPTINNFYVDILKTQPSTVYFRSDSSNPNIVTIFNQLVGEGIVKV